MMRVETMVLGAYQVNCYLIWEDGSKKCLVIDPGYDAGAVLDRAEDLGLTIEAILLTHGHFDHVGAVRLVAEEAGCKVYLCKEDTTLPERFTAGPLYYTDFYGEGDTLTLADLTFSVLHTPGHTPGSVSLLFGDTLFSGDTLFKDSCGRVDLDGGNSTQELASLKRLAELPGDYEVYPGHMDTTTLAIERIYNPYIRAALSGVTEF